MFKIKITKIKQNIQTKSYDKSFPKDDEYMKYFYEKFKKTGKFISSSNLDSDSLLKEIKVTTWRSRKDFQDFLTDNEIYKERMKQYEYEIKNNIQTIIEVENV